MSHLNGAVGVVGVLIVKVIDSIDREVVLKWAVVMEVPVRVDFVIILTQEIVILEEGGILGILLILSSGKSNNFIINFNLQIEELNGTKRDRKYPVTK